jgi:hypothetical protein
MHNYISALHRPFMCDNENQFQIVNFQLSDNAVILPDEGVNFALLTKNVCMC